MRKPNRISASSPRRLALRRLAAAVLVCTAYPGLAMAAVDFSAAVSHQGYFFVGSPGGAYTVSVTNVGDSGSSSPVSVSQSLPEGMTFASASADWDCSASTGQAVSCTYSGAVSAGEVAPDLGIAVAVTESASATSSLGAVTVASGEDANAANDSTATHDVSVKPRPVLGLEIAKEVDSPTPAAGTPIAYTITVRNESAVDLTNIQVDEFLPDSSRVIYTPGDASWSPPVPSSSYDDNAHVWTIQALAAGQEAILTLPVTVAAAAPAEPFANTVEITAGPEAQINSLVRSAVANVAVGGVELAITKVVDVDTPDLNDTVVYTLEVSNHGSTNATGVTVSDTLPAGLTYDSVAGTYTQRDIGMPSVSGSTLEWTGLAIDSGETLRIDVPATVTGGNRTVLTNNAQVLSDTANDQFDPDISNNADSAAIAVGGADVEIITELSNDVPAENESFEYRVYAQNHGSNAVGQVWLDVSLPSSWITYGIDGASTNGTSPEQWPIQASLPAGGAPVLLSTFPVTVSGTSGTILEFSSTITGAQVSENGQWVTLPDPDQANNTQTVTAAVGGVDLSSQVSALETAPAAGGSVTYRISVTNESTARQATGVSMKFYLPAGLSYQPTGSSIEYDGATSLLTVTDPVLAGETKTFDVVADVAGDLTAGTAITARTTALTADQADPDRSNDSDSATIVIGGADLRLTLSVPDGPYYPGSSVTYTLTLENLSTRATSGSTVRDFLPRGLTYTSASDEAAYSASTGIWTVPALAAAGNPGDSATLDIVAAVDGGTAGRTITNIATLASTSPKDPVSDNDSGQATITVQSVPLVDVSLTMDTLNAQGSPIATVAEQATLRYSLSIANAGPDPARDVQVSDTLPAGLTYVTSSHGTFDSGTRVWSYTAPTIAAGGTLTVTIDTTVDPGIVSPDGTTLSNTAAITGINAVDQDTTPGNETAVSSITVTAPSSVFPLRLRGSALDRSCNVYDFAMDAQGAASATVNDACISGLSVGTGLTLATHGGATRQVDLTSLTVDAAGAMVAGLGVDVVRAGDCSGDVVDLSAYLFAATETCTALTSLAAHTAVQVADGQSVTFIAPVIRLQPGFSAAAGSTFVARTQ